MIRKSIILFIFIILTTMLFCACDSSELGVQSESQLERVSAEKIMELESCQDGAIYSDFIFHFSKDGECFVYSLKSLEKISYFILDRSDIVIPHANSVCFSSMFYDESDEFPLIYINVYNNYSNSEDRREGQCCVYRILRNETEFQSSLIQIIKIDFVNNLDLWKSTLDNSDVRPYGNFVVDTDKYRLYSFIMRDKTKTTRFFEFSLPMVNSENYLQFDGVEIINLSEEDIISQFDCSYFEFIQGCCYSNGKIFTVEGFNNVEYAVPKLRIIDLVKQQEIAKIELSAIGLIYEPEFLDYYKDEIYFADNNGYLYRLKFS